MPNLAWALQSLPVHLKALFPARAFPSRGSSAHQLLWRAFSVALVTLVAFLYLDRRHMFHLSISINDWRSWCQDQTPFDHAYADSLAPTSVLVGVFTVDRAQSRRQTIRQTWARGLGAGSNSSVHVRFVLGEPHPKLRDSIELEQEAYGDLVILDIHENMDEGKTYAWFSHVGSALERTDRYQGLHVDYVMKADDDTFIVPTELERHLRVTPRESTYWGFSSIQDGFGPFMVGGGYALSANIVRWISRSHHVERERIGHEDIQVGKWMEMYPGEVHQSSESCWIYDYPKSNTGVSHGFLFPSEYARIRAERGKFFSPSEIRRRGGPRQLQTYSTVVRFDEWFWGYRLRRRPQWPGMTTRDKLNQLVEGQVGRVAETWEERFLGLPHGGTVFVHQVKGDDAMFECALILMEPQMARGSNCSGGPCRGP